MYDKSVIQKHLQALLRDIENLEKYKNVSVEDFNNNLDLLWILERGIYLSIQNIFDIFAHIVSSEIKRSWDSYSDIAIILFEAKKITSDQRDLLINMSGFRNRLSHDYLGLDSKILVDIVKNRLDDLYDLSKLIAQYVGIDFGK